MAITWLDKMNMDIVQTNALTKTIPTDELPLQEKDHQNPNQED